MAILDTTTRSEVSLQTKLEAFLEGSFRFLIATKKTSVVGMFVIVVRHLRSSCGLFVGVVWVRRELWMVVGRGIRCGDDD